MIQYTHKDVLLPSGLVLCCFLSLLADFGVTGKAQKCEHASVSFCKLQTKVWCFKSFLFN